MGRRRLQMMQESDDEDDKDDPGESRGLTLRETDPNAVLPNLYVRPEDLEKQQQELDKASNVCGRKEDPNDLQEKAKLFLHGGPQGTYKKEEQTGKWSSPKS